MNSASRRSSDFLIIGGGIVGLATAYQLSRRFPGCALAVLEKEPRLAEHQTGHNSGVLHSGIYYKPGSLKAINCREGKLAMERFCAEHSIDYEICGKVIVATAETELDSLERIYQRGLANGVRCRLIDRIELRELEPHVAGVRAIHVAEAGIVNYRQVCERLGDEVRSRGGEIHCETRVERIEHRESESIVETTRGAFPARLVVNCGGLHCDRLARLGGMQPGSQIIPFRGEYFEVKPEKHFLCRNLIYPVPDPQFPFLGVHFTRMVGGGLECGPNAVLAFAREGYRKLHVNLGDMWECVSYRGFRRLIRRHWRMGMGELWRSFSKAAFVRALQRLIPEIRGEDLAPAPAGIRAQAVLPDGGLVDDFQIVESSRMVNIINAPSPAATASLNIGDLIAARIAQRGNLPRAAVESPPPAGAG